MFCKSCGTENKDGSKFCTFCGNTLNPVEVPKSTPVSTPPPSSDPVPAPTPANIINNMTDKQIKYLAGVLFGIYFLIVTVIMFKKPENWSMLPAAWQEEWRPNYFLYFILLALGIAAVLYGYKIFAKGKK